MVKFSIKERYSVEATLFGVDNIPQNRNHYDEGMKLYMANDGKLLQLLVQHGNDLSVAQGSSIKILLNIEQYRLQIGGREHHKHPIARSSDKANLICLS
jgi:hypothetical protein